MNRYKPPAWTPPIDGYEYPIERNARGVHHAIGGDFELRLLKRGRWRATYTGLDGMHCRGWGQLEDVCVGLTRWIRESREVCA
jgi:hypothetical protein